jgi:hypothetical protein
VQGESAITVLGAWPPIIGLWSNEIMSGDEGSARLYT